MEKIFIVNPASGEKKSIEVISKLKDAHIFYTEKDISIKDKLKGISNSIIYAVGGDGTLNDVVNSIVGTNNYLSIIPTGSGNDFYRVLKEEPTESISNIGMINGKYFINVACIGIDAEIAYNSDKIRNKGFQSSSIYKLSILSTLLKHHNQQMKFTLDREHNDKFSIITICNGGYYGGGFNINPKYDLNNDYLELYYVDNISKLKLVPLIGKLKVGDHLESQYVHYEEIKGIDISSNEPMICNYDGENMIEQEYHISLTDKKIKLYNDRELVKKLIKH